ncbi:IS110 family transposase [Rhizobium leguminosarum]|uniref:IS110 family transposase n=1 Tax=Rhizobium TaxID=379 RepID=UPI0013BA4340|nr:IS110 family transposase [Rhizobium leguminosarum]MBY5389656.1 IS110 family transposase [Rhizobium leguminosarum]MBY5432994.1 IS110 family transposase [Rhizobium leguminosarum]NEK44547.1 IS110 family transposase [Rhizobium leguminosarum]
MNQDSRLFVGLDVSKLKISVAVADSERGGEVRFVGDIPSDPASVSSIVKKLAKRGAKLHFCYEAGPTGYELYRQLIEMGHDCVVVAPALIPKRPGDRVKTNRRDAVSLARLHRAGELTPVWVPDRGHEAMRDLVRARDAAQEAQKRARQQLQSFLLRHGRIYPGRTVWSQAHMRWMSTLKFEHPAHFIVLKEYCQAIEDAEVRLRRLTDLITETVKSWTMGPVVHAYQALRGVSVMAAVVFVVEIGDIRRFENPRQLMAFLGLVPSESSTGEHVKRGGITKAGNGRARRVLIEGAWTYRFPARVSRTKQRQLTGLPRAVREIAWKGQVRLCARYRAMLAAGKHKAVTITAIAREMGAFLWAIGQEVQPAAQA